MWFTPPPVFNLYVVNSFCFCTVVAFCVVLGFTWLLFVSFATPTAPPPPALTDTPLDTPTLTPPNTRHTGYVMSTSPDPPTPPTRLIAAIVSKRFVTLSWQPPSHTGSSDVTGYSVFWRENGSNRYGNVGQVGENGENRVYGERKE